jgi:GNAT superfamily N-acetyltransferase
VLESAQRFLDLAAVDWRAVERTRGEGARPFRDVRLLELEKLPDAMAEAFLSTRNRAWADQPRPIELLVDRLTLEGRRAEERAHELKGWQWRTLVSQEPDGAISGITDTQYDPATPELVRQYFTGVAPEHRRRGLATWLKAEMLVRIRERYPHAKRVMTNNGAGNAPMLAINHALGFGDPIVHHTYRFDVPDLRARLAGCG